MVNKRQSLKQGPRPNSTNNRSDLRRALRRILRRSLAIRPLRRLRRVVRRVRRAVTLAQGRLRRRGRVRCRRVRLFLRCHGASRAVLLLDGRPPDGLAALRAADGNGKDGPEVCGNCNRGFD